MNHWNFQKSFRKGYFFVEALIAMMIVSAILGGTLTLLSSASAVAQGNRRQLTELVLCEELMESIRQQWFSSADPVAEIFHKVDLDEQSGPQVITDWRNTSVRPGWPKWPPAFERTYSGQYKIQPLDVKHVQANTLFLLHVRVKSNNQDEMVSLCTFLPLTGVPGGVLVDE